MIAVPRNLPAVEAKPAWHSQFMAMVPAIKKHAELAFRAMDPEGKEEAIAEVVASAFVAFHRLAQLGKTDIAYPTPLALYGVKQYREGRHVGTKSNIKNVSCRYAQQKKRFSVGRLDRYDHIEQQWLEILVEDRSAGPADIVATKLDFGDWLKSLSRRQRRITEVLAVGETTQDAAKRFGVSFSRISQVRRELKRSWESFQGEKPVEECNAPQAA